MKISKGLGYSQSPLHQTHDSPVHRAHSSSRALFIRATATASRPNPHPPELILPFRLRSQSASPNILVSEPTVAPSTMSSNGGDEDFQQFMRQFAKDTAKKFASLLARMKGHPASEEGDEDEETAARTDRKSVV